MPTWEDFKRKHVLNPTKDTDFESWDKGKWNGWLNQRAGNEFNTSRRNINSVIVARSQEILDDFRALEVPYTTSRGDTFFWSNRRYRIYIMNRQTNNPNPNPGTPYTVRDLGNNMRFVTRIEEGQPVHFHGQNSVTQSRGNINLPTAGAREIN